MLLSPTFLFITNNVLKEIVANNNHVIISIYFNEVEKMQVEKLEKDATRIIFYDDYIINDQIENVKMIFEITVVDAIKRLIKAEKI